jgi:hypothetical protein
MTKKKEKKKGKRGRKLFDGKDPAVVLTKLEQAYAVDASDSEAALYADISAMSLSRYLKSHPAFSLRKEALKQSVKLKSKVSVANAVSSNPELALKVLERRIPKEYAPLQRQATTDNEGNDLQPHFSKDEGKL